MGTNKRHIGKASEALAISVRTFMALRKMKTPTLAAKSGVPLGTLRKIFSLASVIDFEQLQLLAAALDVAPSQIVARAEKIIEDGDLDKITE